MKLDSREKKEQAAAMREEVALMEDLRHPNIVTLLGTQQTDTRWLLCSFFVASSLFAKVCHGRFVILMEYVSGKSIDALLQKFGPLKEPVVRSYAAPALCDRS